MKIQGKTINPPKPVHIVIPRGVGEDVHLYCGAVIDYKPFDQIYPEPKPPVVMRPGQASEVDVNNKGFRESLAKYHKARSDWMFIQSLAVTPDLVWETIDLADPNTYNNFNTELEAIFTPSEVNRIVAGVLDANVPTEERQKEAMARFQRSQAEEVKVPASEAEGHGFTQSGGLANG
jgi:hypothetical protein